MPSVHNFNTTVPTTVVNGLSSAEGIQMYHKEKKWHIADI
jgi:hypothetical protein